MSKERIAILFDIQNLYHSSKIYGGSKINYKQLKEKIANGREVAFARAYAAHKDGKGANNFYSALKQCEIDVCAKRVIIKKDGKGHDQVKVIPQHFDVEISVDAMATDDSINTIVLCTGNGNFAYLAKTLVEQGANVEVWSFAESTSEALKEVAKFVPIPKECLLSIKSEEVPEAGQAVV